MLSKAQWVFGPDLFDSQIRWVDEMVILSDGVVCGSTHNYICTIFTFAKFISTKVNIDPTKIAAHTYFRLEELG